MTSSSLTPEEIRAAAETHDELGHEYKDEVIESFLEKVSREIDDRVDARLNGRASSSLSHQQRTSVPGGHFKGRHASPTAVGIVSLTFAIPLTAIVAYSPAHLTGLIVVWAAIVAINIAYAIRPHDR